MCGIIGFANYPSPEQFAKEGLAAISYRGKDHSKLLYHDRVAFGHNLHSIIDFVPQPLESSKGILVINCEIYNWKELAKKNKIKVKNDAELVLALLDKKKFSTLPKLIESFDGDFAFAYYSKKEKKLLLARDIIGVKPLVYFIDQKSERLAFASEKKALNVSGIDAVHLNPRQVLVYDLVKNKATFFSRKLLKKKPSNPKLFLKKQLVNSIQKRIPEKNYGILLSGGLDSSIVAEVLQNKKIPCKALFAGIIDNENGFPEPKDLVGAIGAAAELNCDLKIRKVSVSELETELPKIISLIESTDPIRVGVASTIYFALKEAESLGLKVVFSGLGADELFAGYHRFKNSNDVNKDCYSYLIKMYENDLYFEDIISMANRVEMRVPFLDRALVEGALGIPSKLKLAKVKGKLVNKKILRETALSLGVSEEIAYREKKAAQYGSNFDKAIEFISKKNNFKSKADYLNSLGSGSKGLQKNIPIAALLSTGKDSIYALHLMERQGYEVRCLITIQSKNPDSFMFHTPTVELAKLQARAMGKKLIIVRTSGEKEKELAELEKGILVAKKIFRVEGVCSGALFSNYQRERIERICEDLGLRSFSPLWHMPQQEYIEKLEAEGFDSIISKIACYGLNQTWLGRRIDSNATKELAVLEKKFKINVAGEGGEYESLVLDAPLFKQKLAVEFKRKMTNDFTGEIEITSSKLIKK